MDIVEDLGKALNVDIDFKVNSEIGNFSYLVDFKQVIEIYVDLESQFDDDKMEEIVANVVLNTISSLMYSSDIFVKLVDIIEKLDIDLYKNDEWLVNLSSMSFEFLIRYIVNAIAVWKYNMGLSDLACNSSYLDFNAAYVERALRILKITKPKYPRSEFYLNKDHTNHIKRTYNKLIYSNKKYQKNIVNDAVYESF